MRSVVSSKASLRQRSSNAGLTGARWLEISTSGRFWPHGACAEQAGHRRMNWDFEKAEEERRPAHDAGQQECDENRDCPVAPGRPVASVKICVACACDRRGCCGCGSGDSTQLPERAIEAGAGLIVPS